MPEKETLDSWKEIARYLHRTEKTCRIWEINFGLPVHRLDGSPKARVFAYVEEIDRWKEEKLREGESHRETPQLKKFFIPGAAFVFGLKKTTAFAGLLCLFILTGLAMIFFIRGRGQAFDSIAVLPLENLSQDQEQEFFSDGMHDRLIAELSKIKAIKIISRTSVMGYKNTKKRIPEIANELGVKAIVEGTTVRSGNIVRINVQLIDGRSDKNLWADSFDREYRDVLNLQSETALAIAKRIRASLTPEETKVLKRPRSINPEAYEAYLKGMFLLGRANEPGNVRKGIQYFEKANIIDPNFALGYAGLALAYTFETTGGQQTKIAMSNAKRAALKALSLDESLGDARALLANIKATYEWDWEGADKEFRLALELSPNFAWAHLFYAFLLCSQHRNKEAISHAERALELDPFSSTTVFNVVALYANVRQYDKAMALIQENLRLFPNELGLHFWLSWIYYFKGMAKELVDEYQKWIELGNSPNSLVSIYISALFIDKSRTQEALKKYILERNEMQAYDPFYIALIFALIKENDKAFEWLDKCYEQKYPMLFIISVAPQFENLHGDRRFAVLLKKMGLKK